MLVQAIAAVGRSGEIGRDGGLPWRASRADMRWFRNKTADNPVIMGRRTWESLSPNIRPLTGRLNVIVTWNLGWNSYGENPLLPTARRLPGFSSNWQQNERVLTCRRVEPADILAELGRRGADLVTIIGGHQTYESFWPWVERFHLTRFHADYPDADTFFRPDLDETVWSRTDDHTEPAYGTDNIQLSFHTYRRELTSGHRIDICSDHPCVPGHAGPGSASGSAASPATVATAAEASGQPVDPLDAGAPG